MEPLFIDGLICKKPHEKAPDFVKVKLSIKREDLIKWLQNQTDEWINADIKESKEGKYYSQVDTWKPSMQNDSEPMQQENKPLDELPF